LNGVASRSFFDPAGRRRRMLQTMNALSAASSMVSGNRAMPVFKVWASTALRLTLGCVVLALVYFAVLLAIAENYQFS
jgi:hypothetical protein